MNSVLDKLLDDITSRDNIAESVTGINNSALSTINLLEKSYNDVGASIKASKAILSHGQGKHYCPFTR